MNRNEAVKISKNSSKNKNLFKHMLACEASMRALANHFNDDADKWGLSGLLHDIDYDRTENDFPNHAKYAANELKEMGCDNEIVNAVARHPGHKDNMPQSKMDWALYSVDPLTGLIVAATLMHPSKKIANVDTEFVLRRFKEKRFAAGANREQIAECESKLDLPLEEFITITLDGMKSISKELGL